jgi:hypothetical protein
MKISGILIKANINSNLFVLLEESGLVMVSHLWSPKNVSLLKKLINQ